MLILLARTSWRKPIAGLLTGVWLALSAGIVPAAEAAAQTAPPADLFSPFTARVLEQYHGEGPEHVFLVTDLHCQYEVQKNIALVIEALNARYGLRLIGLEGNSGPVAAPRLQHAGFGRLKQQALRYALQQGEISGAEYAYLLNPDSGLELVGVENQSLYNEGLLRLTRVIQPEAQAVLDRFRAELGRLRGKIFNPDLRAWYDLEDRYRQGKLTLRDYAAAAASLAVRGNLDLQAQPFLQAARDGRTWEGSATEQLAQVESFKAQYLRQYARTLEEQKLADFISKFNRLEALLTLTATAQDRALWLRQALKYDRLSLEKFFDNLRLEDGYAAALTPEDFNVLYRALEAAQGFYALIQEREKSMADNLLSLLRSRQSREGLIVVGGFHQAGVAERLREARVSYTVLQPYYSGLRSENHYLQRLQEQLGRLARPALPGETYNLTSVLQGAEGGTIAALTAMAQRRAQPVEVELQNYTLQAVNLLRGDQQVVLEVRYLDENGNPRTLAIADRDLDLNPAALTAEMQSLGLAGDIQTPGVNPDQADNLQPGIETNHLLVRLFEVFGKGTALLAGGLLAWRFFNANTAAGIFNAIGPGGVILIGALSLIIGVGNGILNRALGQNIPGRRVAAFSPAGIQFNDEYMSRLMGDRVLFQEVVRHELFHQRLEMLLLGRLRNLLGDRVADILHALTEVVAYTWFYGVRITVRKVLEGTAPVERLHQIQVEGSDLASRSLARYLELLPEGEQVHQALQAYTRRNLGLRPIRAGAEHTALDLLPDQTLSASPNAMLVRIFAVFAAMATSDSTPDNKADALSLQATALRLSGIQQNFRGLDEYARLSNLLDRMYLNRTREFLQALDLIQGMDAAAFQAVVRVLDPQNQMEAARLAEIRSTMLAILADVNRVYQNEQLLRDITATVNEVTVENLQAQVEQPALRTFPTILNYTEAPEGDILTDLQTRLANTRSLHTVVMVTSEQDLEVQSTLQALRFRSYQDQGLVFYYRGTQQLADYAGNRAASQRPFRLGTALVGGVLSAVQTVSPRFAGRLLGRVMNSPLWARGFADYFIRSPRQGLRLFAAFVGAEHRGTHLEAMLANVVEGRPLDQLGSYSREENRLVGLLQQAYQTNQAPANLTLRRMLKLSARHLGREAARVTEATPPAELERLRRERLAYFSLLLLPRTSFNPEAVQVLPVATSRAERGAVRRWPRMLRAPRVMVSYNALYVNPNLLQVWTDEYLGAPPVINDLEAYRNLLKQPMRRFSTSA